MIHQLFVRTAAAAAILSSAGTALAHPGHGETPPATLLHVLLEPQHGMWIAALAAMIAAGVISWRKSLAK